MKKIFLSVFVLIAVLLCGCGNNTKNSFEGKQCIKCGADATCYCGVKFDSNTYQTIDLYYCDKCKKTEMGNVPAANGDFTDPNNPNRDAGY